jgi:hypothetical protein
MSDIGCVLRPQNGSGINLSGESGGLSYSFAYGGRSTFNTLVVAESSDAEIIKARAGITVPLKWSLSIGPRDGNHFVAHKLWMLGRGRAVGPNKVLYTLVDRRYALGRKMVDTWFNKLRVSNDFNRPTSDKIDTNVIFLSRAQKHHFIPNTCKDAAGGSGVIKPKFFPGRGPSGSGQFQPWTAYQAIRWLLSDDGWLSTLDEPLEDIDGTPFSFGAVLLSPRLRERKVLLRSWNPRKHWPDAMNELLGLARMGLFQNQFGQFVLEDLEPTNGVFNGYGQYLGAGGIPIRQDLAFDAPREKGTGISYPTWDEIRYDYDEQVAEINNRKRDDYNLSAIAGVASKKIIRVHSMVDGPNSGTTFKLLNVLPLPQDVKARGWKAGQWMEVFRALRAWFIQARDDTTGALRPNNTASFAANPENVFSPAAVRRYIMTAGMAHTWIRDTKRVNFRNTILEARAASMYQNYRQTFMIPEEWMDQIDSWRVEVGTVFAGVSRTREPSPIKMDFWAVDANLYPSERDKLDKGTGHLRNNEIDGQENFTDFQRSSINPNVFKGPRDFYDGSIVDNLLGLTLPAPGSVYNKDFNTFPNAPAKAAIIDPARGVFRIDFVPDFTGQVVKYRPGLVNPRTIPASNSGVLDGAIYYGQARMLPTFRVSIILSIKWKAPNHYGRHVKFSPSDVKFSVPSRSFGPPIEIFSRGFEAYRTYEHKKVKWKKEPGGFFNVEHKGQIANEDILKEFSHSQYERLYFRFLPRILGEHSADGWTGQMPIGHINEVRVTLKRNGALETTLNGSKPPALPGLFEDLSSETRNMVQRFEIGTSMEPE